mgnify:CR=1 FL=1
MRTTEIIRKTKETDISLKLNVDGKGISSVKTGCGFLDHMLILSFRKELLFVLICSADEFPSDPQ